MCSLATIRTKLLDHYILELAARNCLLGWVSKAASLQTTITRLHALVLTTTNQNKKVASPQTGDSFSTQSSFFIV